jgi:hypothetical protein
VTGTCSELVVRPIGSICLRSTTHRRLFDRCSHALADFFRMEIEVAGLTTAMPRTAVPVPQRTAEAVSLSV